MVDVPKESELPEFEKWAKIPRLKNSTVRITEKIDGTNAHIIVPEDSMGPVIAASRNRYITPGPRTDNFGFAQWVENNQDSLRRLGPGRHYGEWFGAGIGRGYGLSSRLWYLFETWREADESGRRLPAGLPDNVGIVPTLVVRSLDMLDSALLNAEFILKSGSVAVPGYMRPEGYVVELDGRRYKHVFDKTGPSPENLPEQAVVEE